MGSGLKLTENLFGQVGVLPPSLFLSPDDVEHTVRQFNGAA